MKLVGQLQLSENHDRCSFLMPSGEVLELFEGDVDFDPSELVLERAWGIEPGTLVLSALGRVDCLVVDDTPEAIKLQLPTASESDGLVLRTVSRDLLE